MFSDRVPADLAPNRLALAVERFRASGQSYIDFTESNPTRAGFSYRDDLLAPLGDRPGLVYAPSPFGTIGARAAVAADYARRGLSVDPDRIVLTASTSEAYSVLFKLLCAPEGDQVLVKVLAIEGNKIRLSRKALIREAREKQQKKEAGSGAS